MLDRRPQPPDKASVAPHPCSFLGISARSGVLWSVRDQPGSRGARWYRAQRGGARPRARPVRGRLLEAGTGNWRRRYTTRRRRGSERRIRAATGTLADPGRGRWVFVQQDGVGGYVLTQNHRAGPPLQTGPAPPRASR